MNNSSYVPKMNDQVQIILGLFVFTFMCVFIFLLLCLSKNIICNFRYELSTAFMFDMPIP